MPSKSSCWNGSSRSSAAPARGSSSRQDHLLHDRQALVAEEHVLGAAEADALGAELARPGGVGRRVGVGAHAQRRSSSAQPVIVSEVLVSCGGTSGTAPSITSPVAPSIVITSPSCTHRAADAEQPRLGVDLDLLGARPRTACPCRARPPPRARSCRRERSGRPAPARMPWMSSGVVSSRTRITSSPVLAARLRLSASKTTAPTAAPGDAVRPWAISARARADGSMVGCSSWSSWSGSIRSSASSRVISPSHHVARDLHAPRPPCACRCGSAACTACPARS